MKHKIRWIVLICALIVVIVLGLVFRYVPMNIIYPPESAFHLELDSPLPSELKVGDQLTVSARLVNSAWMSYKIMTGTSIIMLNWTSPSGGSGQFMPFIVYTLWAGEDKTQTYTYDIPEPGDYTLTVTTEFFIGFSHRYNYELDPVVFHVVE